MRKNPLDLLILWHLHQPIYYLAKNTPLGSNNQADNKNHYILPWVRMHSIKAYLDMARMSEKYPEIGMTINMTASLLSQLGDYSSGNAFDYYQMISMKNPKDLNPDEKNFLIEKFFQANWDTMIKPYPGYARLLALKQENNPALFQPKDLLDLQAWFNLSWFGFSARKEYPEIMELIKKDRNFALSDKEAIFEIQNKIVKSIIPLYKKVLSDTQTEISTTPFYHPILPLLIDTDSAHRAMPQSPLPARFSYPGDARKHIQMAKELFKEKFGNYPNGFWPAEGSLSPEAAELFIQEGVQWIATDEEILMKTLRSKERQRLFQYYKYQGKDGEVTIFFRDKGVSDSIGFRYAKMDTQSALNDLFQNLENISKNEDNRVLSIILDGENPWEYYMDGGQSFLEGLYAGLLEKKFINPLSMNAAREKTKEAEPLQNLFTGSWIYSNFKIWIGGEEDNRAWDYLQKTRKLIEDKISRNDSQEKTDKALENIFVAEGSDWFWWYGDDFQSESKKDFDTLFRSFLMAACLSLDEEIPDFLMESVIRTRSALLQPIELIYPVIDGSDSHYYEWQGSIKHETSKAHSAIFNSRELIERIYYGFSLDNFFIRIQFFNGLPPESDQRVIKILWRIHDPISRNDHTLIDLIFPLSEGVREIALHVKTKKSYALVGVKKVVEVRCSFEDLLCKPKSTLEFGIELLENGSLLERHPLQGYWKTEAPSADFYAENWFI